LIARKKAFNQTRQQKLAGFAFKDSNILKRFQENAEENLRWSDREKAKPDTGVGVGVGVVLKPGDSGVGVGVAVGVGVEFGVGLGLISVGPFGVAVGVGLGVGAKSGVGETVGVGVGEEFCAKALRGGTIQPAIARNSRQHATVTARALSVLAPRNRITQDDAAPSGAVGPC